MSRYIDADKLYRDEIKRCGCVPIIGSCSKDNKSFKDVIDEQPTADVVEVVRCKDCLNTHLINDYPYCELWNFVLARDNFCSFGKRRENE